ncbi:MAG TPA: DUF6186 family protein [Jiangellaceae bacterium]|nr:DUF6186 family protein [Jiangellaceae bacterium]
MSSRTVTIIGYLVLGCATTLLIVLGRLGVLTRSGDVTDALLARRGTRVLILMVWAWLGWHFLVRTG